LNAKEDRYYNKSFILVPTENSKIKPPKSKVIERRDYSNFPPLKERPRLGDVLAFQLLELNGWVPEIITKEGTVTNFSNDIVTFHIDPTFNLQENDEEGEEIDKSIFTTTFSSLSNVRLISRK